MIECNYCLTNPTESYNGKCPNCGAPIYNESNDVRLCMNPNNPGGFLIINNVTRPGIDVVEFEKRTMRKQLYKDLVLIR